MTAPPPALELSRVVKEYRGLRPLRLASLTVAQGERVALAGIDRPAAEVLVNLLTGAALPDEGEVRIFGRSTVEIATGEEWLGSLDRFGIVTDRAPMLETATLAQNLALPFTLQIDPVPDQTKHLVESLARDVRLSGDMLSRRAGDAAPDARMRAHVARAIALNPSIVIMEHPTAGLAPESVSRFAEDVGSVAGARGLTLVAITEDATFARRAAGRHLRLDGATGELTPVRRRRWV
jgi:ABC-type transporter Mla maintaining outer membrane lipid asymmetry ATPase subunit MlaF